MFRHTRAILRENVDINKTFMIQRQMREWNDNNTDILNVDNPCSCGSASRGGRFNLWKEFPVSKGQ